MIDVLGYISAFLFAFCGVPQAYKSWRDGNSAGMSALFLWMWLAGEVGMLAYTILAIELQPAIPLLLNYVLNLIVLLVIMKYFYYPRQEK